MSVIATLNGQNIIALPCDTMHRVVAPSSIEWDPQEAVAASPPSLTGSRQFYDWMQSWWSGQVSFASMTRVSFDAWSAFILECRGGINAFMLGDPKARRPKGIAAGHPLVAGAGQSGYQLATHGWDASAAGVLAVGDHVQVGYRLHKVLELVNADAGGAATLKIWPPLREAPADGDPVGLYNCKGLFRLAKTSGNKFSVNFGMYGLAGFSIEEAL
jgi:hypothetical protein